MRTEPTRLELEIQRDDTPQIHGSLSAAGQRPVRFTGWLELISLIERASGQDKAHSLRGAPDETPQPPDRPPTSLDA